MMSEMASSSVWRLAPDPDDAVRWRDRLAAVGLSEGDLGPEGSEVLRLAAAHAPYLAMLALRDPAHFLAAAADPHLRRPKPRERLAAELAAELAGCSTGRELARRLRGFRDREYIRLGAREL